MFAFVFFEAPEDGGAFVDDTGVDPCRGETAEVGAFTTFVNAIFFSLFVGKDGEPAGIDFFEDAFDFLEAVFVYGAVEFEKGIDGELGTYRCFKLEECRPGREDIV